jgi:hypothetical protein
LLPHSWAHQKSNTAAVRTRGCLYPRPQQEANAAGPFVQCTIYIVKIEIHHVLFIMQHNICSGFFEARLSSQVKRLKSKKG